MTQATYNPVRGKRFFSSAKCPGGSGPTQPSTQSVLMALSPRVKWPGQRADYLTPASTEVKNEWIYTFNPPVYHCVYRENFTLFFHVMYPPSINTILKARVIVKQPLPITGMVNLFTNCCKIKSKVIDKFRCLFSQLYRQCVVSLMRRLLGMILEVTQKTIISFARWLLKCDCVFLWIAIFLNIWDGYITAKCII